MTRKENLEKCKKLLYESTINIPLSPEDTDYLLTQIFPLHKRWEEKKSGKSVKHVIVRKHPLYQNKCFALFLEDGDIVDISFLECINRPRLVKDIEDACKNEIEEILAEDDNSKSLKSLVSKWVKTFNNEELTVGKFLVYTKEGHISFNSEEIKNNFKKYYKENV